MFDRDDRDLLQEESTGYLVSVSDMMSGLLFIFLITLAAFILNYQRATKQTEDVKGGLIRIVGSMVNQQTVRGQLLGTIKESLDAKGVPVKIDEENGILHLTENAIRFETGRADLAQTERDKLDVIGAVLLHVLPCYTTTFPEEIGCPSETVGMLEALFIEGHTDNVPIRTARFADNWDLSAARAIFTYRHLIQSQPGLDFMRSAGGERLLSVTGYGEGRPLVPHQSATPDLANRRIDLRFIMAPPQVDDPLLLRELKQAGIL